MKQWPQANYVERKVWGICLIAAPLLLAIATFFWGDGTRVGITGGVIQVYSLMLWIPALLALFNMLRDDMPRYAVLGALLAIYTSVGGNNFGMEGIYEELFGTMGGSPVTADELRDALGFASVLVLLLPGALFPLNLLVLAIILAVKKVVPFPVGVLLALGAIAFPLARVPDIRLIAHIGDLLLLIPMAWIGWKHLTQSAEPA